MTSLIVPLTVMLLRGAFSVLVLAVAEKIFKARLSGASLRRLWLFCLFLMFLPQPEWDFHPVSIDMTWFQELVIDTADLLPQELAAMVGDSAIVHAVVDFFLAIPGVTAHSLVYFIGMVTTVTLVLLFLLCSYIKCRRQTSRLQPVSDARILQIWHKIVPSGQSSPVLLDSGNDSDPPVLFGFFRQKLLLPESRLATLSDSELELLLTHEYIHFCSRDGIINVLTLALLPLSWYNPFFLLARRHLRISCELACDEKVLARYPERTAEYGKLLLSFADTVSPSGVTTALKRSSGELSSRIQHMACYNQQRKSDILLPGLLALLLLAPFGLFSTEFTPHNGSAPQTEKSDL